MYAHQFLEVGLAVGMGLGFAGGLWAGYFVGIARAHKDVLIELETALDETESAK